jgi:hypothetical protein
VSERSKSRRQREGNYLTDFFSSRVGRFFELALSPLPTR